MPRPVGGTATNLGLSSIALINLSRAVAFLPPQRTTGVTVREAMAAAIVEGTNIKPLGEHTERNAAQMKRDRACDCCHVEQLVVRKGDHVWFSRWCGCPGAKPYSAWSAADEKGTLHRMPLSRRRSTTHSQGVARTVYRLSSLSPQQLRQLGEVHRHASRLVARQPIWSPSDATQQYVRNRGRWRKCAGCA
jgi:hypothetical protein